jgi:hypothetical protein
VFENALDPKNVMAFAVERAEHRGRLTSGAERLFRVYLSETPHVEVLAEKLAVEKAKAGKGGE